MEDSIAAGTFRAALRRHEEERLRRLEAEDMERQAKAARGGRIRPMAEAVLESLRELALVPEYQSVVGTGAEMSCDGLPPAGVPLARDERPRPDAWLTTFPLDDATTKVSSMPPVAVIVGIQADEAAGRSNVWVHVADGAELATARRMRTRLPFLFEEGTLVAETPEEAAEKVVGVLVELVACYFVKLHPAHAGTLALEGVEAA